MCVFESCETSFSLQTPYLDHDYCGNRRVRNRNRKIKITTCSCMEQILHYKCFFYFHKLYEQPLCSFSILKRVHKKTDKPF